MLKHSIKLLSAFLLLAGTLWGRSYETTFLSPPAPENPISESSNWTNGGAAGSCSGGQCWANVQTAAGKAFGREQLDTPSGQSYRDATAIVSGSWGRNQSVQAVVYTTAGVPANYGSPCWAEVELRLNTSISNQTNSGYELDYAIDSAGDSVTFTIVKWNGALGSFSSLAQVTGSQYGIKNGDILAGSVVASGANQVITAYKNGAQILQYTDSSSPFTGGAPGMGFNAEDISGGCTNSATNPTYGFSSFSATDETIQPPTNLRVIVH